MRKEHYGSITMHTSIQNTSSRLNKPRKFFLIAIYFFFTGLCACDTEDTDMTNKNDIELRPPEETAYSHLKQLTLPEVINTHIGESLKIYLDNIVLIEDIDDFIFTILLDGVETETHFNKYWEFKAIVTNMGSHKLEVFVKDKNDVIVDYGSSQINVIETPTSVTNPVNVLIVGDSLTADGRYITNFGNRLKNAGINEINFIGSVSKFGYEFEGFGGNTWATYYSEVSTRSPFVYPDTGLDFNRYFIEKTHGTTPDIVIIMLGINDIFKIDGSDPITTDRKISEILSTADMFIDELKSTLPTVKILISTISVPNIRKEAFTTTYGANFSRKNYRKVQHRFVQLQFEHFGQQENENIYLLPITYGIDSFGGFEENNALHPNTFGYLQIADIFFNAFNYVLNKK